MPYTYYEFFAGGGMARIGLGENWQCLLANDICNKKAACYHGYFGSDHLLVEDVAKIETAQLPGVAQFAWASFPCQDLSLAGNYTGLSGERSGLFWPFWHLMQSLQQEGRAPGMIVLENVRGAITSHGGRDLVGIAETLIKSGYRFAPLLIDAVHFVPQSRPRLFIVAVSDDWTVPEVLTTGAPMAEWHPDALGVVYDLLSPDFREKWIWLRLPMPELDRRSFDDLIDDEPEGVNWHTQLETKRLISMMSPVNRAKVKEAQKSGRRCVGTLYRRTRIQDGVKQQRAEVRFDVAGCLRTPVGGSSRQTIILVNGNKVRSRLLAPREAARLMGLPEDYPLPVNYNNAYHLAGDGVVVPVVRHLAEHILLPIMHANEMSGVLSLCR